MSMEFKRLSEASDTVVSEVSITCNSCTACQDIRKKKLKYSDNPSAMKDERSKCHNPSKSKTRIRSKINTIADLTSSRPNKTKKQLQKKQTNIRIVVLILLGFQILFFAPVLVSCFSV